MGSPQDTIAAIATPLGEGGLGVVRISGSLALRVVQAIFRPLKPVDFLSVANPSCHVGILQTDHPIDQVVVTIFRAPHSYTGEDVVEISAHGSPFVLRQILALCLRQGARLAEPGEFTLRAYLSGKIDLTQAEAVADLIHAKTEIAHRAAMAQLQGHLAVKVRALRDRLLPLLAHIEVGLDHSDEDHDFLSRDQMVAQCQTVEEEVARLLESVRVGKILREGLRVALVGRPNVGKSSLLNALLKQDRAIVTPIAGTTRDTLEETVDWNGLPVVLTDTAGVRETSHDTIERLGMERAHQAAREADVILALFDRSEPLTPEDERVIAACLSKPHLWVINKNDLPARWEPQELGQFNGRAPIVSISAKTGDGLPSLVQGVQEMALQGKPSGAQAEWMINTRHQEALERVRQALSRAREAANAQTFEECVAMELKIALQALGEIIGETASEDLLDQIFSKFCVGK
jgi:tRNA modification GTPase